MHHTICHIGYTVVLRYTILYATEPVADSREVPMVLTDGSYEIAVRNSISLSHTHTLCLSQVPPGIGDPH